MLESAPQGCENSGVIDHWWKRYIPHCVAGVAFIALACVSLLFWREVNQRFPRLTPGAYLGWITFSDDVSRVPLYVEAYPEQEQFLAVVLADGWKPQMLSPVPAPSELENPQILSGPQTVQWYLPVALEGPRGKVTLMGSSAEKGSYQGELLNSETRDRYSWHITPVGSVESTAVKEELTSIRLWLLLKAELAAVDRSIEQAQEKVPQQRAEIEKLTNILNEGEKLKSKANEKFQVAQKDYDSSRSQLTSKREEVAKLWDTFDISQRVTKTGKLVALARESLEKEWQWAQTAMAQNDNQSDPELEAAYERAEATVDLKHRIEQERQRIRELSGVSEDALDFRARMSPPRRWKSY